MTAQEKRSACCKGCLLYALCFASGLHCSEILGALLSQIMKWPKCFSSQEPSPEYPFLFEVRLTTLWGHLSLDFFNAVSGETQDSIAPLNTQVIRTKTSLNSSVYLLSLWLKAYSALPVQKSEDSVHTSQERDNRIQIGIEGQMTCMLPRWCIIHSTEEFAVLAEYLMNETCSQLPVRSYIFKFPILSFGSHQSWSSQVPQAAWIAAIQTSHASHS